MAHRTDIFQVHKNFPIKESSEILIDPNCGRKLTTKETRSVLFREGETLYFCSRDCREKYLNPSKQTYQAQAA